MARKYFLYLSTKDIAVLHQVTPRTARNLIKKMRIELGKAPDHSITIKEYCLINDVDEESVMRALEGH